VKQLRQAYVDRAADFILSQVKFIDETGIHLALTQQFGRAAPGQRVVQAVPDQRSEKLTLVAALGLEQISAPWVIDGAMDGVAFEVYVRDVLGPTLAPGDLVVMDNLSVHKRASIQAAIEQRGARLVYLSPYSPDFNPIEHCWSKIKTALRAAKARTVDQLIQALKEALLTITQADIQAWFTHCGYPVH
jgi:transposase